MVRVSGEKTLSRYLQCAGVDTVTASSDTIYCSCRQDIALSPHLRCKSSCTRLSRSTSRTIRVAMAAASPKFKTEKPTW
jgi:hypothetical protein